MTNQIDLTECDREPIHLLGKVQSFGFLLAVDADWVVSHASRNLQDFLGIAAEAVLGLPLADLITRDAMHALRGALQTMATADAVERVFDLSLVDGQRFDLAVHRSDALVVIEAEPTQEHEGFDATPTTRSMVVRLQRPGTLLEICEEAARQVRALTGFDRVMIYRFDEDGAGEVIAERAQSHLSPYLGLRYPATDIPRQARVLYTRNVLRIIADVADDGSTILARTETPLDLSLGVLRAVSPVHIEYLRNMGVAASMSISILHQGELWGLIACHHGEARHLSLTRRTAAELFGQMFSFVIESRQRETQMTQERFTRELHDRLIATLAAGGAIFSNLAAVADDLCAMIDCDGLGLLIGDRLQLWRDTPDEGGALALVTLLNRMPAGTNFATDHLVAIQPEARQFVERAAGVLAIPISTVPGDYLLFFRREWRHSLDWAGHPEKILSGVAGGERLNPRKSFIAWTEAIEGHSRHWHDGEMRVAEHLRVALREVIFRLSDAADRERRHADEKRELLIAELNHRVRNILGLIRGLVAQSRDGASGVEQFIETVSGRIHALARAHDQITADQWSAAPLRSLIEAEGQVYLLPGIDRVVLHGPDVLLDPHAFSTVALVVHELMTNAAKYGAFSTSHGQVRIDWQMDASGRLALHWEERGGPAVRAPTRRGFGSTIIERSIPFDLKGKADLKYALEGLRASFVIPAAFVKLMQAAPTPVSVPTARIMVNRLHGRAMVLEDNMVIALDAEDILLALGADSVDTVSSVREAIRIIDRRPPSFALLDFNLGDETSLPVALLLRERAIPFMFATGYGEEFRLPEELVGTRVVKKPYNLESFGMAL